MPIIKKHRMRCFFLSGIHGICLHIVVDSFAVLLFFLLNVVECVARAFVLEFKNAGVVKMRGVLFGGKQVRAEKTVGLLGLIIAGAVGRGKGLGNGGGGAAAIHSGNLTVFHAGERLQMASFNVGNGIEQHLELRIGGALGVLGVFVDAKLFLTLEILDKTAFLLCELHNNTPLVKDYRDIMRDIGAEYSNFYNKKVPHQMARDAVFYLTSNAKMCACALP